MNKRIDKKGLYDSLGLWNGFLKRSVHLIACGGTALTLLDIKPSTKDIDLLVPDINEYKYLIKALEGLGYTPKTASGWIRDDGFIFDIFPGKRVHSTELLDSPINKGNNMAVKEYSRIYLGVLNYYDILITKLFRGSLVDFEDCLMLIKNRINEVEKEKFVKRFRETAAYDVAEDRVNKNLESFLGIIKKEGLKW